LASVRVVLIARGGKYTRSPVLGAKLKGADRTMAIDVDPVGLAPVHGVVAETSDHMPLVFNR